MDSKNILRAEYLYDLLYVLSGGLANAWLTASFDFWNKKILFLDNYLIEGNSFIYIILYFSFSFVLGVSFRELGEILYRNLLLFLKFIKNPFKLNDLPATFSSISGLDPQYEYFIFRERARLNAHQIFLGFFTFCLLLSFFCGKSLIYILLLVFFTINSIRCISDESKKVV